MKTILIALAILNLKAISKTSSSAKALVAAAKGLKRIGYHLIIKDSPEGYWLDVITDTEKTKQELYSFIILD